MFQAEYMRCVSRSPGRREGLSGAGFPPNTLPHRAAPPQSPQRGIPSPRCSFAFFSKYTRDINKKREVGLKSDAICLKPLESSPKGMHSFHKIHTFKNCHHIIPPATTFVRQCPYLFLQVMGTEGCFIRSVRFTRRLLHGTGSFGYGPSTKVSEPSLCPEDTQRATGLELQQ